MNTPVSPVAGGGTGRGLHGPERTRQQLQELDALLQQMLALPLADPPAEVDSPPRPAPAAPQSAPVLPVPGAGSGTDPLTASLDTAANSANSPAPPAPKRPVPLAVPGPPNLERPPS